MTHYIGIDIGGTNVVCGLVREDGELLHTLKRPTDAAQGSADVFDRIALMADDLIAQAGVPRASVAAVGVGTPGFVDPVRGVTLFAGNLRWTNVPTAAELERRIGVPVFIDNDVRMYVYGEVICGAARGFAHVLGITLGTGLAAAVVTEGKLYYGGGYMAGELGHIKLEHIPYSCGCGMTGCLETAVSANGIARQAKDRLRAGEPSVLRDWFPGEQLDRLTAADVSRAFDAGDAVAADVMRHTGSLLGKGLACAVTLLSPDVLVIGGGAAHAGERLFAPMREELQRSVYGGYWERLTIVTAERIDDAGILGSAMNAKAKQSDKEGR